MWWMSFFNVLQFTCRVDSSSCKTANSNAYDLATKAASFHEPSSRRVTLPVIDGTESVVASISEHVQRELFSSLETHLTDYIGILIEDGANIAASTVQDGKMHEVRRNIFENFLLSSSILYCDMLACGYWIHIVANYCRKTRHVWQSLVKRENRLSKSHLRILLLIFLLQHCRHHQTVRSVMKLILWIFMSHHHLGVKAALQGHLCAVTFGL